MFTRQNPNPPIWVNLSELAGCDAKGKKSVIKHEQYKVIKLTNKVEQSSRTRGTVNGIRYAKAIKFWL